MQAIARVKYLGTSPRKMRQVAQLIKGRPVEEALNILNYTPKAAAYHMAKTLKAAAANAISGVGTAKLKAEDLSVTNILVDQAPTAKRVRFQSMGRVFRIRKRFCHLTIVVEGEPEKELARATRSKKAKKETAIETKSDDASEAEGGIVDDKKAEKVAKAKRPAAKSKTKKNSKIKSSKKEDKISDKEDQTDSDSKSEKA
jgi:large subunit ribosomal protein L22